MDTNQDIITQIVASESQLLKAIQNSDVHALDALLHEDLLFNLPGGETITKEIDMETYRTGNMAVHKLLSDEQVIHIIGDTAVVSVKIEIAGKYFGAAFSGAFRYIRVWKSFEGAWKVIAGSSTQL